MSKRARRAPTGAEVVDTLIAAGAELVPPATKAAFKRIPEGQTAAERGAAIVAAARTPGGGLDALVETSRHVLASGLAAVQIGPEDTEPPAEWVKELGIAKAAERFRIAKSAWNANKDAPHYFAIAAEMVKADAKVRAAKQGQPITTLNVAIQMNLGAGPEYPSIEVDE